MLEEESTDKRNRGMISLLKSSCDVLKRLIEDASDIALIEEGSMRINNESVSIPDLLLYIDRIYSGRFAAKGLGFSMNTSPEIPDHISGDTSRIIQIFINIMDNALKYTSEGNVSISITLNADRTKIFFEFTDTGTGIPQKRLNEIFKPFNISDDVNRKHASGTGLGLAISKRLAMLMGGDISVESRKGKGSRFLLSLPLGRPGKKTDNEPTDNIKMSCLHPMNILAVDDIPENIELLKLYFSGFNINLIEAFTGKEAIDLYKSYNPDCVLLDMYLPDIDGQAVAKKIREHEKSAGKKRTPIIGISADCMKEHILKALDAGCDVCLVRPVERIELFNQISSLLAKTGSDELSFEKKPDDIEDVRKQSFVRIKKIASELLNACRENDFKEVKRLGHALMGLGMTFRFEHIEETGREIIKSTQNENSENIIMLVSRIVDSLT
jgi:CheY-like chemotaxis protein